MYRTGDARAMSLVHAGGMVLSDGGNSPGCRSDFGVACEGRSTFSDYKCSVLSTFAG